MCISLDELDPIVHSFDESIIEACPIFKNAAVGIRERERNKVVREIINL